MTSPTNLFRLPFAEDVSAGERLEALARQVRVIAASDFNLPARSRGLLFDYAGDLETEAGYVDEWMLAACKEGELP